jgi:hypothetical protein
MSPIYLYVNKLHTDIISSEGIVDICAELDLKLGNSRIYLKLTPTTKSGVAM